MPTGGLTLFAMVFPIVVLWPTPVLFELFGFDYPF